MPNINSNLTAILSEPGHMLTRFSFIKFIYKKIIKFIFIYKKFEIFCDG